MASILDEIISKKEKHVESCKGEVPLSELEGEISAREEHRSFTGALGGEELSLIAEIKSSSPSAGEITALEPETVARVYQRSVPAAVSVLTDAPYFGQDLGTLRKVRNVLDKPILRKDFIIDSYQLHEAAAAGADAVLLIVNVLSRKQLAEFYQLCEELDLTALVEIHDREELEKLTFIPELLGVNNRQLSGDFTTDLQRTEEMLPILPRKSLVVSESGIQSAADFEFLRGLGGVDAALVGTSLLEDAEAPEEIESRLVKLTE